MYYRVGRAILAVIVVVASLPLALLGMERGFGLAATLTIPTCCLGLYFSLASPRRTYRIGWFAFSTVCVALLPLCPWWQRQIEAVLNWVQGFLRSNQPTFLYSAAETVALLCLILIPWGAGCALGWLAAILARKLLPEAIEHEARPAEYRFTLRGMLVSITICAALTAWLSGTIRQWHSQEQTNQEMLLRRFTASFTSGNVTLLAEPELSEDHTIIKASQNSSGISEYRIVAPIRKQGRELWAVWTFLCNESYPGTVSKFGYAEAPTESALPPAPFPAALYLREPNYTLIDGEPQMRMQATIINAPTVAKAGDTITIVAKTDRSLQCVLVIRPFQAVAIPPPKIWAPRSGIVRWDVKLNPAYVGSKIEYEFQARTNMWYRAKTAGGAIMLQQSDEQPQAIESTSEPVPHGESSPRAK